MAVPYTLKLKLYRMHAAAAAESLSRVRLCATPWTAAHQAPPSMGFSRQEHWSGVPLPSLIECIESQIYKILECEGASWQYGIF